MKLTLNLNVEELESVAGGIFFKYTFCDIIRSHDLKDFCGHEAKWFQPKEEAKQ